MNLVWPACLSEHFTIPFAIKELAKTAFRVLGLCPTDRVMKKRSVPSGPRTGDSLPGRPCESKSQLCVK
jgi:hypothetical protein